MFGEKITKEFVENAINRMIRVGTKVFLCPVLSDTVNLAGFERITCDGKYPDAAY